MNICKDNNSVTKIQNEDAYDSNKIYLCIDLKSFYASVECMERGLDPMRTNLVVADPTRTEKTICLAVSPSLKAYGVSGRARLFEAISTVKKVNAERLKKAPGHKFTGSSCNSEVLEMHPEYELSFIAAPPRMAHYMKYSTNIYNIYLKYIAPEDIHVYSIDEVFIDLTPYLKTAKMEPRDFAKMMIRDVLETTGITATAGIGTNMYLAKIAMDIEAKHISADKDGVRIAELDEKSYREKLWSHRPITDFWRVGKGYAKRLYENGLYTMGDIALCSVGKPDDFYNEELLYKLFGVNAELLIDHAWGYEPCQIKDIKAYKPQSNSLSSGQVLHVPYEFDKARLVVREMIDLLTLDLVDKCLVTDQIVLTVGYDIENITDSKRRAMYKGEITVDAYGRKIPKHAHGTANIGRHTASTKLITEKVMELYDKIVDRNLLIRRLTIAANHVIDEADIENTNEVEQLDLFTDYVKLDKIKEQEDIELEKEKDIQKTLLEIKKKFGKNAVLKGMNLQEGATAKDRNKQIGGHKA